MTHCPYNVNRLASFAQKKEHGFAAFWSFGFHLVSPMRPLQRFPLLNAINLDLDCSGFFRHCIDPLFWCRQTPATLQKEGNALNAFCRSRKSSTPEENAHNARGRPGLQLKKCLESRSPKKNIFMWFFGA